MTAIAFAPRYNTGTKKDATGAFQPEAREFCCPDGETDFPFGDLFIIDNHLPAAKMRAEVLAAIAKNRPEHVAFFCHGWQSGIQFGFGMKHVRELAKAIAKPFVTDVVVREDGKGFDATVRIPSLGTCPIITLFCCLTADGPIDGDGGFADKLRDELCDMGAVNCRVDAHTTAGPTTMNPNVRRFDGMGSPTGGMGGQFIVAPGSTLWARWKKALKGDLRFQFSAMEIAEIHEELVG